LLEVEIYLIPRQPYDDLGHADGMLRWLDNDTLLVNDYSATIESKTFQVKFARALKKIPARLELLPYHPLYSRNKNRVQPAHGTYINFLDCRKVIFFPSFGEPDQDEEALNRMRSLTKKKVVSVDCWEIAAQGGVLNCVTWQYTNGIIS